MSAAAAPSVFSASPLLQGLTAPQRAALLAACSAHSYGAGAVILDAGGSIFLAESDALLANDIFRTALLGANAPHGTLAYGQPIVVSFISYLRPEMKFAGLDALEAQIAKDSEKAREILR